MHCKVNEAVSEDCAMDIWSIGRIETELATMVSEDLSAQMPSTLEFFHPFFGKAVAMHPENVMIQPKSQLEFTCTSCD